MDENDKISNLSNPECTSEELSKESALAKKDWNTHSDLFENDKVAMLIVNCRTGRIEDANEAACILYGYDRRYIRNIEIEEIEVVSEDGRLANHGSNMENMPKRRVMVHRLSGGKTREVEVSKVPFARGDFAYLIVNDISEVRNIKKEMELRDSYFQNIFENSPEAIAILDNKDRVIKVNRGFEELFKYDSLEIEGMYINDLIAPKEFEGEASNLTRNVLSGKIVNSESVRCTKYGRNIEISILGHPILHDGVQIGVQAIYMDITEKKKKEKKIEYLAMNDGLTGIYNRGYFIENLISEIDKSPYDSEMRLAVMFIDIDEFKRINDNMGHTVGDVILRRIAKKINRCIEGRGYAGRMGGDEFTVLLKDVNCKQEVVHFAEKIVSSVEEPIVYDEKEFHISVSIGISIFPEDGNEAEMLIRKADMAMYNAKMKKSSSFDFYNSELRKRALEEFMLENELRNALRKNEFSLKYQPLVDASSGLVVGAEALIRWQNSNQGMISPNRFIPLAERKGMIGFIGEWVLENACTQMKRWMDEGYPLKFLAVNISVKQLESPEFMDSVRRIIMKTGVDPSCLEFEITESISMNNLKNRVEILSEIDDMGIALSIDDFGTGYSSLGKLKKLAVRKLKIDRSFIKDINIDSNNTAIVSTIIAIAKILNMKVVAEGVETVEQLEFLRDKECDFIQGYYYSPPVEPYELEKMMHGQ